MHDVLVRKPGNPFHNNKSSKCNQKIKPHNLQNEFFL
jgi:hypothetical protein